MESTSKEYLKGLSNEDLDDLYSVLVRSTGNHEPNIVIKEIEEIMTERYNEYHKDKQ